MKCEKREKFEQTWLWTIAFELKSNRIETDLIVNNCKWNEMKNWIDITFVVTLFVLFIEFEHLNVAIKFTLCWFKYLNIYVTTFSMSNNRLFELRRRFILLFWASYIRIFFSDFVDFIRFIWKTHDNWYDCHQFLNSKATIFNLKCRCISNVFVYFHESCLLVRKCKFSFFVKINFV